MSSGKYFYEKPTGRWLFILHPKHFLFRNIVMKQEIDKFEIDPPKGLREAVSERIKAERKKKAFRKKALYFCGFFVSGSGILFSMIFFGKEILISDFWNIILLLLTDMRIVSMYWQEFFLSLLETFPFEALAVVLAPTFMLLVLMKKYTEQQNIVRLKFN